MTLLPKAIYRFYAIPIKIPREFFRELEQIISILYGNKRSQTAKIILRKNTAGGVTAPWFLAIIQSYCNQHSMVLPWTHRSMEQYRKNTNKPIYLWPNPQKSRQEYTVGKKQSFQYVMKGKLDIFSHHIQQ